MSTVSVSPANSPKSRLATALLAVFLGELGIHRFYLGKIKTAVIMLVLGVVGFVFYGIGIGSLLTGSISAALVVGYSFLSAVGIWALVDFIIAVVGKMKDKEGRPIQKW